ncbi:hypothetical protein D3C71_1671480 [compost metagenome]
MQFAQVRCAAHRIFQALIRLIDAHGPLHSHALGCSTLGCKFIRVGFALQLLPACINRGPILHKTLHEAEEFKVVRLQVHANSHMGSNRNSSIQQKTANTKRDGG